MHEWRIGSKIREGTGRDDLTMASTEAAAMAVGGVLLQVRGDGNTHWGDLHEALRHRGFPGEATIERDKMNMRFTLKIREVHDPYCSMMRMIPGFRRWGETCSSKQIRRSEGTPI